MNASDGRERVLTVSPGTGVPCAALVLLRSVRTVEFLFLDGNHTEATAQHDYAAFAPWIAPGGLLAVHDVFADPADGGQAPFHVLQRAVADGFTPIAVTGSLHVVRAP